MEVTLEVLQAELGKLRAELCAELRVEFRAELEKMQIRIIQWVVGIFIGAIIVVGTIIGVYTSSLIVAMGGG